VNSANADLLRQVGERNGTWVFNSVGGLAGRNIEGHDVSPTVVGFDGDGVPDFLGGRRTGGSTSSATPAAAGSESDDLDQILPSLARRAVAKGVACPHCGRFSNEHESRRVATVTTDGPQSCLACDACGESFGPDDV
jgi:hypothetical protein